MVIKSKTKVAINEVIVNPLLHIIPWDDLMQQKA